MTKTGLLMRRGGRRRRKGCRMMTILARLWVLGSKKVGSSCLLSIAGTALRHTILTSCSIVMTGEEDETTIFKCNAKVFTWDKEAKAWKERGRGHLKVNRKEPREDECDEDEQTESEEIEAKETEVESEETESKETKSKETNCKEIESKETEDKETETKETEYKEIESKDKEKKSARIILRTEGTYVVVLNTPIHGNMRLGTEPSGNSLSFTAIDPSGALSLTTLRASFSISLNNVLYTDWNRSGAM
jgi:hypothetical protein